MLLCNCLKKLNLHASNISNLILLEETRLFYLNSHSVLSPLPDYIEHFYHKFAAFLKLEYFGTIVEETETTETTEVETEDGYVYGDVVEDFTIEEETKTETETTETKDDSNN